METWKVKEEFGTEPGNKRTPNLCRPPILAAQSCAVLSAPPPPSARKTLTMSMDWDLRCSANCASIMPSPSNSCEGRPVDVSLQKSNYRCPPKQT